MSIFDFIGKNQKALKALVVGLPLIIMLIFMYFKLNLPAHHYHSIVLEGGGLEIFTAAIYLATFMVSIFIARACERADNRVLGLIYWCLSLILLVVFLEEARYGQSIFNYTPAAYFIAHDPSNEARYFSLLGTSYSEGMWWIRMLIGIYASFSLIILSTFFSKWRKKHHELVYLICPSYFLTGCFVAIIAQSIFNNSFSERAILGMWGGVWDHFHGDQIIELIIAFALLSFFITTRFRISLTEPSTNDDPNNPVSVKNKRTYLS